MLKKNLFQVRKRCTNDGRQNRRHSCKSGSQSWFYKISEFQSYICISTKSVEAVHLIEPTVRQLLGSWAVSNFFCTLFMEYENQVTMSVHENVGNEYCLLLALW